MERIQSPGSSEPGSLHPKTEGPGTQRPSATASEPDWLREWFKTLGAAESSEYLARIGQWRDAWRPQRVRALLVAESHVAEHPGDRDVHVVLPPGVASSAQMPGGFCRLVYCLGYGESAICDPPPVKNPGTWLFWDLFGAIAGHLGP